MEYDLIISLVHTTEKKITIEKPPKDYVILIDYLKNILIVILVIIIKHFTRTSTIRSSNTISTACSRNLSIRNSFILSSDRLRRR